LNNIQMGLTFFGMVPVVGDAANLVNAGISLFRGNYGDAAVNALAAIPVVGAIGEAAIAVREVKAAEEGLQLFRVFGGEAQGLGRFWTTVNPAEVNNYREAAGLFSTNTGRFVAEGTLTNLEGVEFRSAAAGEGGIGGGLPEVFVPDPKSQINLTRISGVNPPF
jgi:hypothetical protein